MEHGSQPAELLRFISDHGVVRSRDISAAGFQRMTLTRLVTEGRLQRLSRGLYCVSDHAFTEWHDLAEVSKELPAARIALVSALAFHGIGTQTPHETWVALPVGARTPKSNRQLRIVRYAEPYYSAGIETYQIEGVDVLVYSAAKTVADCFKMRSRVGYDVAVEALRDGWRDRKFTMEELARYARLDRVERVMRPYIEAIVG